MPKRFDRTYFDKWYRTPTHRVGTPADLERMVRFAIAAAEYVLARPIRSLLDVGAGEGRWAPVVHKLRPTVRYVGVEPSDYALARYGGRRNLVRGTLDDLDALFGDRTFDLVVCCSVLNYLPTPVAARGVEAIARHTGGVAYLEVFTEADDVQGDLGGWHSMSGASYRRMIRRAGLMPCGLNCYVPRALDGALSELERSGA